MTHDDDPLDLKGLPAGVASVLILLAFLAVVVKLDSWNGAPDPAVLTVASEAR